MSTRKQQPAVCEHCGETFRSGAGLALHMRWVNGMTHPREGVRLDGLRLEAQQEIMRQARDKSPSARSRGARVTLTCELEGCTETFDVVPSQAGRRKYCSKSCLGKSQSGRPGPSAEHRRRISEAQKDRYARNPESNPFYGRTPTNYQGWGHGGYCEKLGFHVRSTWERDYLCALKDAGVEFEYEVQRFSLGPGEGTYMPDIRLGGKDVYVEITGWDKPEKIRKRELFKDRYGYPLYVVSKRPTEDSIAEFVAMCKEVMGE